MFLYYDNFTKEIKMKSDGQIQAGNLTEIELSVSDEQNAQIGHPDYVCKIINNQLSITER